MLSSRAGPMLVENRAPQPSSFLKSIWDTSYTIRKSRWKVCLTLGWSNKSLPCSVSLPHTDALINGTQNRSLELEMQRSNVACERMRTWWRSWCEGLGSWLGSWPCRKLCWSLQREVRTHHHMQDSDMYWLFLGYRNTELKNAKAEK